jgi:lysophospholipid acyltransferase (LPLAT)-like uncharacterized protein
MRALRWRLAEWPVGFGLWAIARGVTASSRVTVAGAAQLGPAVYVSWHGQLVYLCDHHGRARRWLIAGPAGYLTPVRRCASLLGLELALGTSGDGGEQALAHLEVAVRAGGSAVFAVDGPAGPSGKAKPGAARLAQRCGVPVIPVSFRASRCFEFRDRWDRLAFPLPFSEIDIQYGQPLSPDGLSEEELCRKIEAGLSALSRPP